MRKLSYPALGILAAAWIALYCLFVSGSSDPGSQWQLLKPATMAPDTHQTVVGPNVPVDTPPEENTRTPLPRFHLVSTTSTSLRPTNRAVTSDGTVLFVQEVRQFSKAQYRPQLVALRFHKDGESLQDSTCISNGWWHDNAHCSNVKQAYFPQLAADPGSKRFASHVYCVWADGNHDEGVHIFFSSSPDHGANWSQPTILSQQPETPHKATVTLLPSVAVNNDGVVAVSWHQRHSTPDSSELAPDGWNVRFRASLDGGTTWLSSVQVNEESGQCNTNLAHAEGLSATDDGQFHPTWINKTNQLQTAAIELKTATKER